MTTSDNIRDALSERIFLDNPSIIVAEYIPFGRNHIYEFNRTLGSMKRVRSSLLTSVIDSEPDGTTFEIQAQKTRVSVKNFTESGMVEFEAEIFYPEAEGIEQIEQFGVHVDAEGLIVYGGKIAHIGKGRSSAQHPSPPVNVSVDKTTRILADLVFDSSRLMATLLTYHQRQLLDLVYFNNPMQRDKYTCIVAREITPPQPAAKYLDSGDLENELKQILEYVDLAVDLPDGGTLHAGGHGTLLVSKNYEQYEVLLTEFCFLRSIQIFLTNFYSRIYSIEDDLRDIRRILLQEINRDPRSIAQAQTQISTASFQSVLLQELLGYLQESLAQNKVSWDLLQKSFSKNQKFLLEKLGIVNLFSFTEARMRDTTQIIAGIMNEIQGLRDQVAVISEKRLRSIFNQIRTGTSIQLKTQRASERQESKLKVLEYILAGSLALELIALVIGEYTFVESGPLEMGPVAFFLVNLVVWAGLSAGITLLVRFLTRKAEKNLFIKINFEVPVNLPKMAAWLDTCDILTSDLDDEENKAIRTVTFIINDPAPTGPWRGHEVNVSLSYDMDNGFLYAVDLDINQPRAPEKFFRDALEKLLREQGILQEK